MPSPNWDDEDNNQYPTVDARKGQLSGPEVAFVNSIRNKDPLSHEDQQELRRIWYEVGGDIG